jgi:hypothetical protein
MASPEQRPELPASRPFEIQSEPMVVTDGKRSIHLRKREKDGALLVQVRHEETIIFTAAVAFNEQLQKEEVRMGFALSTTEPSPSSLETTQSQDRQPEAASQEQKEKEEPVMLRGRIATDIRRMESPTGGTMARFQFAEHPNRSLLSYWHSEPENKRKPLDGKSNTVYRTVGVFDDYVALVEGAEKGQEYDLTCFKRSWQEPSSNGKTKTVEGFYLLGLQKVTRRGKQVREHPTQQKI